MADPNRPRRPRNLKRVLEWLEYYGFRVYNQSMDVETGQEFPSLSHFSAEEIPKYVKWVESGKTWSDQT